MVEHESAEPGSGQSKQRPEAAEAPRNGPVSWIYARGQHLQR